MKFQFTPARGGRHEDQDGLQPFHVSIHARAWRATAVRFFSSLMASFNSRPRVAGDVRRPADRTFVVVSIHARAWRATVSHGGKYESGVFQFTPARGGRPGVARRQRQADDVSIHARAWRATVEPLLPDDVPEVSIHARAWRATVIASPLLLWRAFQFTPARGGRPKRSGASSSIARVSIHARAWRATHTASPCFS